MDKSYWERKGCWNCGFSLEDWDYETLNGLMCDHPKNRRKTRHKKPRLRPVPVAWGGLCRHHEDDPDKGCWT